MYLHSYVILLQHYPEINCFRVLTGTGRQLNTIQWIVRFVLPKLIYWIEMYLMDSIISLKNRTIMM